MIKLPLTQVFAQAGLDNVTPLASGLHKFSHQIQAKHGVAGRGFLTALTHFEVL